MPDAGRHYSPTLAYETPDCTTARHTAATVLLLLGVPERAVMDLMGWSQAAMAKRYQHITTALRDDIAGQLGGFLWQSK
jgi:integrase